MIARRTSGVSKRVGIAAGALRRVACSIVSEDFRIRTRSVDVEASLGATHRLLGQVFLHDGAGMLPDETIVDLMNDPSPFFPLRLRDVEATTLLVSRSRVRYMFVPPLAADERICAERDAAMRLEVVVQIGDDESLSGILYAVLPPGKRRTLDFLNTPGEPFFVLVMDGRDCLINRAHVRYVRDHNPAIDGPLPE